MSVKPETRTFAIQARRYTPGRGRQNIPAEKLTWEKVEITIDWSWLLRQVGEAAVHNRTKKSSAMAGAIIAKHIGAASRVLDDIPGNV
jgi:hypothetical protein